MLTVSSSLSFGIIFGSSLLFQVCWSLRVKDRAAGQRATALGSLF
jgi:hypothetical protein